MLTTPLAAPRKAYLPLEIAQRPLDRAVVSLTHLVRDVRLTGGPQDAHALRRPERQIETGDRSVTHRPAQLLASARVARLQQPSELMVLYAPAEPEGAGAAIGPLPGRLPLARVVILRPLRDLFEVVPLRPRTGRQLPQGQHAPTSREPPPHPRCRSVPRCWEERAMESERAGRDGAGDVAALRARSGDDGTGGSRQGRGQSDVDGRRPRPRSAESRTRRSASYNPDV